MNTFSNSQVYYTAKCGLPTKFYVQKIVIDYAEGSSSLSEYTEFYNNWNSEMQQIADDLVMEIFAAQSKDDPKFAKAI